MAHDGYPNPREYQSNEKLILDYTQKVGETEAVKKIMAFLESQYHVAKQIRERDERRESYAI